MNSCNFVGRLARDPELKTTSGGYELCNFTIAVDRNYKNAQGEYEADFINCTAWRQTAEFVTKWFTKGDPIAVTGSLQIRKYQASDGTDRWASEIQASNVGFVPGKPKGKEDDWRDQAGAKPVDTEDVLPFDLD